MNYKTCTVEELAVFFSTKTTQAITQQLKYYQNKGDADVVVKIKKARILDKQQKLAKKLEGL